MFFSNSSFWLSFLGTSGSKRDCREKKKQGRLEEEEKRREKTYSVLRLSWLTLSLYLLSSYPSFSLRIALVISWYYISLFLQVCTINGESRRRNCKRLVSAMELGEFQPFRIREKQILPMNHGIVRVMLSGSFTAPLYRIYRYSNPPEVLQLSTERPAHMLKV